MPSDIEHAKRLSALAVDAGAEILKLYDGEIAIETKDDRSPVTAADQAAEDVILAGLAGEMGLGHPVVSEEAAAAGYTPKVGSSFWLVDPLDGTKEFISKNGEFTVNIALIDNGAPVLGVVHTPALGEVYVGVNGSSGTSAQVSRGGAWTNISCRPVPERSIVALVSRSHRSREVDAYIERFDIGEAVSAGSSLKFCRVAEGVADLYPRLGRTMEWDTAAAHAVLAAAGGHVETLDGNPLRYGKPGFENPHFVAYGAGRLPG
ncbi:MAG: 3'(2'),5'-bisphosphate nucleotidase CysQ [Rhodospirillales bacterium]